MWAIRILEVISEACTKKQQTTGLDLCSTTADTFSFMKSSMGWGEILSWKPVLHIRLSQSTLFTMIQYKQIQELDKQWVS